MEATEGEKRLKKRHHSIILLIQRIETKTPPDTDNIHLKQSGNFIEKK